MRIVHCCDDAFLSIAGEMVRRLEVGLLDDAARLLRVTSSKAHLDELAGAEVIELPEPALLHPMHRRVRAAHAELRERSDGPADIVHAFGLGMFDPASKLAELDDAVFVVEIWAEEQIRTVLNRARRREGETVLHIAAPALADRVRDLGWNGPMFMTPWGSHALPDPPVERTSEGPICVVLTGPGSDAASWESCADALFEDVADRDLMVFCEAKTARDSGLLRIAREADAMSSLTLLPPTASARELLTRADLALHPDPYNDCSLLLLECMAHGVSVVVRRGALAAPIEQGRAVSLAGGGRDQSWTEVLSTLIDSPAARRVHGERGWTWVKAERRASAHVASVVNAYDTVLRPVAMAFPGADAS